MKHELWVQVEEAYAEAAQLPPEARTPFLNAVYQDRPDIRHEVESLLEHQPAAEQLKQSTILLAAAEMFTDDDAELIGTVVANKYLVRECLGAGGMAEVYLADHIALKIPVALKRPKPELRSDPGFRKSFLEEARRAVILNHDNVARVHDVVDAGDDMFVVMEYIEGETLRRRLSTLGRPFTVEEFLPLAIQCASALTAAHEKRIVHLDVKPENIMLTPSGQIKICDFGIARRLSTDISTVTTVVLGSREMVAGTPAYMAPEVILGSSFDERTDLFSLGIVFYEMLTGVNPFKADTVVATTGKIVSHTPAPISSVQHDIDPRLERIVTRMLAKDPNERYPAARDLVQELTAIHRSHHRIQDIAQGIREAFRESRWLKVATAVVLLCFLASPLAWFYRADVEQWIGIMPVSGEKNLVVLRVRAIGSNPDIQAYSDGLTETLSSKLTQLTEGSEWRVAPTSLIQTYKVTTAEEARKELGADLVLEASLDVSGDILRINFGMVDTNTGKWLRTATVDGQMSDPFGFQDRVVSQLVRIFALESKTSESRPVVEYGSRTPQAMEYYTAGRGYLLNYQQPENIDNAISVFQRAIEADSQFALAYAGLGEAHWYKFRTRFDKGQLQDARMACEHSLALASNLAAARICLGNIHNSEGNYSSALEELQQARSPVSFEVLSGLATAYEGIGSYDLAEEHLRQAANLYGFNWLAYGQLGSFYFRRSRFQDAADLWQEAIKRSPDNPRALVSLGGAYIRLERFPEAVAALERSIALHPSLEAYSNLANAYWRMGQLEKALPTFQQAAQLWEDYRAAGNLARAYYASGKKQEAITTYNRAIQLSLGQLAVNPRNPDVHILLARYYAMLGQKQPATDHLQFALNWSPDDWHYLEIAAIVYNQFNDPAQALKLLEKARARGLSPLEMRWDMEFQNLHGLPQFQALLQSNQNRQ